MARVRTVRKEILLSPEEWERIRERARACAMKPGVYLRTVALGAVPRARPRQPETDAVRRLTRIGTHLGQRAQAATRNGEGERAEELLQIQGAVVATIRLLA